MEERKQFNSVRRMIVVFILLFACSAHAAIEDVYVVHFIIDGTNYGTFKAALDDGLLPTIQERIVERGATFTNALSNFPTTSTAVYQSYVTGLYPGHAGIPFLERMDRDSEAVIGYLTARGYKKINTDLINTTALLNDPATVSLDSTETIFELLGDCETAAVYSSFFRGAKQHFPRKAPLHALWSTYATDSEEKVDVLAYEKVLKLYSGDSADIPRYALVGLMSADIMGHKYGPASEEVREILVQLDLFLKDFLALLERRGILDKTYILISADHGMREGGKLFELRKDLQDAGVFIRPMDKRVKDFDLYSARRGVTSSQIYVRHSGGFEPLEDPDILKKFPLADGGAIDLIDYLLSLEPTDLLVIRAGDKKALVVNSERKTADIACYDIGGFDYCSYRFDVSAGDPLGYSANPKLKALADGKPHSSVEWLAATAGEEYPFAPIQMTQIFEDGRAGDIILTTRAPYSLRKVKKGNHGGPELDEMRVPFVMAGPTVPHGEFAALNPPDVFVLLLEWFGIDRPAETHDGANPFAKDLMRDFEAEELANLEQMADSGKRPPTHISNASMRRARAELERREKLVEKLSAYLKNLEYQRTNPSAPKVVDKEYLADHIGIARRALKWAMDAAERMKAVIGNR